MGKKNVSIPIVYLILSVCYIKNQLKGLMHLPY